MSYLGEFVPVSAGDPLACVDEKARLFRALRSFPQLAQIAHQHELPDNVRLVRQARSPLRKAAEAEDKDEEDKEAAGDKEHTMASTKRPMSLRSVRRNASTSATDEVSALNDFRKVLFAARKSNRQSQVSDSVYSTASSKSPSTRVKEKIGRAALAYDPSTDRESLQAFDGRPLTRDEFKDQLKSCLNVVVTSEELDALLGLVRQQQQQLLEGTRSSGTYSRGATRVGQHSEEDELINGLDFHLLFFKLGEEMREQARDYPRQQLQKEAEMARQRQLLEEEQQREWERQQISAYSQADVENALQKLSTKAPGSNRDSFLDKISLEGFQCVMTPAEFKIQLQKSFGIELTPAELGGLCSHFDIDNNGSISGAEFLMRFTQLGYRQQQQVREAQRRSARAQAAKRGAHLSRRYPI